MGFSVGLSLDHVVELDKRQRAPTRQQARYLPEVKEKSVYYTGKHTYEHTTTTRDKARYLPET